MEGWHYRIVERWEHPNERTQAIFSCYHERGEVQFIGHSPTCIEWNLGDSTHRKLMEIQRAFDMPIIQYDDFVEQRAFGTPF